LRFLGRNSGGSNFFGNMFNNWGNNNNNNLGSGTNSNYGCQFSETNDDGWTWNRGCSNGDFMVRNNQRLSLQKECDMRFGSSANVSSPCSLSFCTSF